MNVTAFARRSDGWWAVEVPAIDGLLTQARSLADIPGMVRDAANLLDDLDPSTLHVTVETVRNGSGERPLPSFE